MIPFAWIGKFCINFLVAFVLSYIIFEVLNKILLRLFIPIQKLIKNSGKEKLLYKLTMITFTILACTLSIFLTFNVKKFAIVLGISYSFMDVIFTNSSFSEKDYLR